MKGRIYYFTGTGNSMRAARIIARQLGDTEIISMRVNPEEVPATDCDVVGFIFPVYHWNIPAPAAAFVEKLAVNPNAYVFAVAMPSFICGISCERLAGILAARGITLDYGNKVFNVANYAITYPPFPSAKLMVPQAERKLRKIAEDIIRRQKRDYPRASTFIRRKRERVMAPYLELLKYADNPFTISADCISCGLCSKVCPCRNIIMENGKPAFQHHCTNCMACVVSCPKRAIGYNIKEGDRKLLDAATSKASLVRFMGLPEKRKLYRNPYISAHDLTKDRELWQKEAKQGT